MAGGALSGVVSSPLSVALYNADGTQRRPYYLVTIDLPAYSPNAAKTLHLSSPDYTGPDGTRWDDTVLELGQINAGGSWLTPKWNPVDLDLVLMDKRVTGQGVAETFHDYMPDYEFVGATVHVQIAFENTTATSDYRTIFYGKVVDWGQMDSRSVTLYCSQDRAWSKIIPPNTITATDFPYAPASAIGARRPIVVGDWQTGVNAVPGAGVYGYTYIAGVTRGAFPCLITEQESASGGLLTPKFMVSDEDMHTDPGGLLYYESAVDALCHSYTSITVTGSGPTYAQLADYQFRLPVLAIEVNPGRTTAAAAQELVRADKPYTLTGKCSLNYDTGHRVVELNLPDLGELGTLVSVFAYIFYNKPLTSGTHPRWGVENGSTVDNLVAFGAAATSPSTDSVPHDSAVMNIGPVATGGTGTVATWAEIKNTTLLAEVRNAAETLEIHRFLLNVIYKPPARVVKPGTTRETSGKNISVTGRRVDNPVDGQITYRHRYGAETSPDVLSYDSPLFAYGKGIPDSGHATAANGHYTGTAGALIEHPVDVVHWALRELGGDTSAVTTSGDFGSFTDARTTLAGYKLRCLIAEEQNVEEFIEQVGTESLCWFFRRTTVAGAPFVAVPWATSASQNYRESTDLVSFNRSGPYVVRDSLKVGRTPLSGVVNSVRVNYDWDPRTRSYGDQLFITPTASRVYSSGFTTDGTRVTTASGSLTRFGAREVTLNLKYIADPTTASSILTRTFDWRVNPRVRVRFATFLNALDLERGHILRLGSDWDDFLTYPKPGGNGSWASKNLQVYSVRKLTQLPIQYEVLAVET